MTQLRRAWLCLILVSATSCGRTVYTNLHPEDPIPETVSGADPAPPQYWRHFYLFGWVPGELLIDAVGYCGGTEHIERIETQESFVQGLIASVAGYYIINAYSPYTGRVVCDRHSRAD